MSELKKKLERCLRVNLLGPGSRVVKKEFTAPLSHKARETQVYITALFQDKTPCTLVHMSQRFGRTHCFALHDGRDVF